MVGKFLLDLKKFDEQIQAKYNPTNTALVKLNLQGLEHQTSVETLSKLPSLNKYFVLAS